MILDQNMFPEGRGQHTLYENMFVERTNLHLGARSTPLLVWRSPNQNSFMHYSISKGLIFHTSPILGKEMFKLR